MQGSFGGAGSSGGVGHHSEKIRSAICGIHSHLYPVVVAWHTGPEEGSQEEMGSPDHSAVSAGEPVGRNYRSK